MKIIICLDNNNGLMFNNRRQSKDSKVIENIFETIGSANLYINDFSADIFADRNVIKCNDFLEKCQKDDYCFVENTDFEKYIDKINTIIIYRWNRSYPFDKKLNTGFLISFHLENSTDFAGTSHGKITREEYLYYEKNKN